MTAPVYMCPHCKKEIEAELTKAGNLVLNGIKPIQDSSPTRKPGYASQVGASPENRERVLKEIDQKDKGEKE